MDNYDISDALGMYAKLAELHDENPFKVKAYAAAAFNLKKVKEPLADMPDEALDKVPGVGKSVLGAVRNILKTGTFPDLVNIIEKTPPGVLDMLRIKGLGPKKVRLIWKSMGLETVEELFNACRENRLVEQTGFGLKTQGEVIHAIEFSWNASGKFHFARIEKPAKDLLVALKKEFKEEQFEFTGAFRRNCEVIEEVEIITTLSDQVISHFLSNGGLVQEEDVFKDPAGFKFKIIYTDPKNFEKQLFLTSATPEHLEQIHYSPSINFHTEAELYASLGLPYIEPEMREGAGEVARAKAGKLGKLLDFSELRGILHNHSTYSDGLHSLKEMAEFCRELGYEYLGICDHSQSATYAQGMKIDKVLEQHAEIDKLNAEMAPFRIFKGIESDILGDGNLDYADEVLASFDLVVASIHSNLKMDEAKANERLKRAIENPYTHILGHPTGRQLLVRTGYPIDHQYIIDACAANGVAIEINANPFRLDLDWRWIGYAMEKGVMLSINPDAHEKTAYYDMYYGTLAARKGGLTKEMTLNALPLDAFAAWLQKKRSIRA